MFVVVVSLFPRVHSAGDVGSPCLRPSAAIVWPLHSPVELGPPPQHNPEVLGPPHNPEVLGPPHSPEVLGPPHSPEVLGPPQNPEVLGPPHSPEVLGPPPQHNPEV